MFAKSFTDEKCYVSADCYDRGRYALSAVSFFFFPHVSVTELPSGDRNENMSEKGKNRCPLALLVSASCRALCLVIV